MTAARARDGDAIVQQDRVTWLAGFDFEIKVIASIPGNPTD